MAHEDGKIVTLTHGPSLPPGISWYSFLEAESTPGHMELSDAPEKNSQWPGIDPGTHYTPTGLVAFGVSGRLRLQNF